MKTILVVEDDDDIRESIGIILEDEGYCVALAEDGQKALEQLDELPRPCLLLVDLVMPRLDGWTLMSVLSKDDRLATMRELARVVAPGGRIGMVEFGVPDRAALRSLWRLHTRIALPLCGRLVSPAWLEVGQFLGPSIERLHEEELDLSALWRAAGIEAVRERRLSFGAGVVMWGRPRPGLGPRQVEDELRVLVKEMARQQRNVFAPVAQRRQPDFDGVQAK